jgi:hypothetical protein
MAKSLTKGRLSAEWFLLWLLVSLPVPLVSLMVYWNPSGAGQQSPYHNTEHLLMVVLPLWFLSGGFSGPLILFRFRGGWKAIPFFVNLTVSTLMAVIMGFLLHRDYFAMTFPCFLISLALLFLQYQDNHPDNDRLFRWAERNRFLLFLFIALMGTWICFAAYGIVARTEPRWAESLFYNGYNILVLLLFSLSVTRFFRPVKRVLRLERNHLRLEGFDLGGFLPGRMLELFAFYLENPGKPLSCQDFQSWLESRGVARERDDCRNCRSECPYRQGFMQRTARLDDLCRALRVGYFTATGKDLWRFEPEKEVEIDFGPDKG